MKNVTLKFKYLAGLFLIVGLFACEGPSGDDGIDGVDGVDGTNGNANVTTVSLLLADITWTEGLYLGRTTNVFNLTESAVTQDVIDHGTVLGYAFTLSRWWALPFSWENSTGTSTDYVLHSYALNTISLYAYDTAGVLNPNALSEYRFLIITDNTVTKSTSLKAPILDKLKNAGVDVNNYYEVADYFGLDY